MMDEISFDVEDVQLDFEISHALFQIVKQLVIDHDKNINHITFVIGSDEWLRGINIQFLDHDYYTDVITFPYHRQGEDIEGDILISLDRIKENANVFNVSLSEELNRICIHGVLHLIGYTDLDDNSKKEMTDLENHYLDILSKSQT